MKPALIVPLVEKKSRTAHVGFRVEPSKKAKLKALKDRYGVDVSKSLQQLFDQWLSQIEKNYDLT